MFNLRSNNSTRKDLEIVLSQTQRPSSASHTSAVSDHYDINNPCLVRYQLCVALWTQQLGDADRRRPIEPEAERSTLVFWEEAEGGCPAQGDDEWDFEPEGGVATVGGRRQQLLA